MVLKLFNIIGFLQGLSTLLTCFCRSLQKLLTANGNEWPYFYQVQFFYVKSFTIASCPFSNDTDSTTHALTWGNDIPAVTLPKSVPALIGEKISMPVAF